MKLFLASSSKALPLLDKKYPFAGKKVGFIIDAGEPYRGGEYGDLFWIEDDRQNFVKMGADLVEITLADLSGDNFREILKTLDIVHICGGNEGYLSSVFQDDNKANILKDWVLSVVGIYSGTSAGAMVAAPSVELFSRFVEDPYTPKLDRYDGLGLVDFLIIPHADHSDFVPEWLKIVPHIPETIATFWLRDSQALWIEDEKMEFLDTVRK